MHPMNLDLSTLPGWVFPLVMFCLGDFFLTLCIRRILVSSAPKLCGTHVWKEGILPSLPVFFGAIAATVMYKYPFLNTLPTWGTRAFYGAVAGGLSSFMYRFVKAVLQAKFGVKIEGSNPPPPNEDDIPTGEYPAIKEEKKP